MLDNNDTQNNINFETSNLILFCYPEGAGGKFIINSLGLSQVAVFQDHNLVRKQFDGKFDPQDKFEFLLKKINEVDDTWTDLHLGCYELFGVENKCYFDANADFNFHPEITKLSNSGLKFFLIGHTYECIQAYKKRWPNAKLVGINNSSNFILKRKNQYPGIESFFEQHQYLGVKEEFEIYSSEHQQIILDTYYQWLPEFFQDFENKLNTMCCEAVIDNEFLNDEHLILQEIQKLYQLFELPDFDQDKIKIYYRAWKQKLHELAQK